MDERYEAFGTGVCSTMLEHPIIVFQPSLAYWVNWAKKLLCNG